MGSVQFFSLQKIGAWQYLKADRRRCLFIEQFYLITKHFVVIQTGRNAGSCLCLETRGEKILDLFKFFIADIIDCGKSSGLKSVHFPKQTYSCTD